MRKPFAPEWIFCCENCVFLTPNSLNETPVVAFNFCQLSDTVRAEKYDSIKLAKRKNLHACREFTIRDLSKKQRENLENHHGCHGENNLQGEVG